jgi:predicted MFS family arabinose efflux permease
VNAPQRAQGEHLSDSPPSQWIVLPAMGAVQILMWGSTVYLPAVLAPAMVPETGWPLAAVIAGASFGLLIAGLLSPVIGRCVARYGGRPVLAFGSFTTATGFVALASATSLPAYWAAWLVLGIGMGSGLYDAAFAALGRIYGEQARSAITNLTLFGGFGSTVCWPLSAWMMGHWGWRTACLVYAAIHLLIALPLVWFVLPAQRVSTPQAAAAATPPPSVQLAPSERRTFWLLAAVQTLAQAIGSIIIVHLLVLLEARGLTLAAAVTLGTLFGPAQVAARVIERLFGHNYHPVWTMLAAALLMAVGLALLLVNAPITAMAVLIYGAGYGVTWIARGTLPLRLFGPTRYPVLIGRLALPSLIALALSPFAGALLIERVGANATIGVLVAMACLNLVFVVALWRSCRQMQPAPA